MASALRDVDPRWFPYSSSYTPAIEEYNLSNWPATNKNISSYYDTTDWVSINSEPYDYPIFGLNDSRSTAVMRNRTSGVLPEDQLSRRLWIWITPLLLIIGTFGNVLSFFTLRSCTFRKCSIAFTLSALAVVDTSVLYTTLLRQWILYLTGGYDVRVLLWSFGCKLHFFLTYYLCQLSSWTLVVVTAERAVCVSMPFMAKTACTKSRIVGSWLLVAGVLAIINSHFLWTGGYPQMESLLPNNRTIVISSCFVGVRYLSFFYQMWYWLDLSLLSIIPFIFIIVGNIVITCCVFRAMKFRREQAIPINPYTPPLTQSSTISAPPSQAESFKPLTSSTTMLIGISVLFLVTTTPSAIYFLKSDDWIGTDPDPETIARIRLVFTITNLLYYANNSLNFLLYCLTGSRFRRAFIDHFRHEGVVSRARRMSRGIITIGTRSSNCNLGNGNYGIQLQPTKDEPNC